MFSARAITTIGLMFSICLACWGTALGDIIVFQENFNAFTPHDPEWSGSQYQTGLTVQAGGSVSGWGAAGFHAVHAVDLGSGDYAVQLLSASTSSGGDDRNYLFLSNGIAANQSGVQYTVSFDYGPTVWDAAGEATQASDKLRIDIFNSVGNVVARYDVTPGAWAGTQSFQAGSFTYVGNGTGDVRINIYAAAQQPYGKPRFYGAIDNLVVSTVPEPSSFVLLSSVLAGLLAYAWRKRR